MEDQTTGALIEANLPLVQHVVLRVANNFPRHVDRRDLARAGALGLVEAAQRFDPNRGVPFHRFAAGRIRGAILDSVRANDWAPRSVRSLARRLIEVEHDLAAEGVDTSSDVVADALGLSAEELFRLRDRVVRSVVLALDYVISTPDDDLTLLDILADRTVPEPDEELETRELLGYLRDAVGLLPERHRVVIMGYFLESRTSVELAGLLGVTESRISQVRTEALQMLRAGIEAQYRPDAEAAPGRAARRRAAYAEAIGEHSTWRDRLAG
ncbi:MAG: sigma-70 family RNA polymerase sigma factor [Acidimicrobiales bacterium]